MLHHWVAGHWGAHSGTTGCSGPTCPTGVAGITSIACGASSSATVFDVGAEVAHSNRADGAVVFGGVLHRLTTEGVFAVGTEDLTELEAATLESRGDGAESFDVIVADATVASQVTVAGLLEKILKLAVVVVATGVLEAGGYQGEGRSLLGVGVAGVEVLIDDVEVATHFSGVLEASTSVKLGGVAFYDAGASHSRGDLAVGSNFAVVDVAILVNGVDVALEASVVGLTEAACPGRSTKSTVSTACATSSTGSTTAVSSAGTTSATTRTGSTAVSATRTTGVAGITSGTCTTTAAISATGVASVTCVAGVTCVACVACVACIACVASVTSVTSGTCTTAAAVSATGSTGATCVTGVADAAHSAAGSTAHRSLPALGHLGQGLNHLLEEHHHLLHRGAVGAAHSDSTADAAEAAADTGQAHSADAQAAAHSGVTHSHTAEVVAVGGRGEVGTEV